MSCDVSPSAAGGGASAGAAVSSEKVNYHNEMVKLSIFTVFGTITNIKHYSLKMCLLHRFIFIAIHFVYTASIAKFWCPAWHDMPQVSPVL